MTAVPYELARYSRDRNAETLAWPIRVTAVNSLKHSLHNGLRDLADGVGNGDRRLTFTVGAPPILVTLLTLGVAQLTAAMVRRKGLALDAGEGTIVRALLDGRVPDCALFFDKVRQRTAAAACPNRSNLPRRIAHCLVTNRGPRLSGRPVTVLNHNSLLQAVARADDGPRFWYQTSDRLLAGAKQTGSGAASFADLGGAVSDLYRSCLPADGDTVLDSVADALAAAVADWLAAVEAQRRQVAANWRGQPAELWTGTGGNHVSRLAAARVREAGGNVVVHEHGGGGHIHRNLGPLHLHEFSLCDRFVADTDAKAEIYSTTIDPEQLWTSHAPEIAGRPDGGHGFDWLGGARSAEIRRVMYVTTAFVGEVQYPLQPLLPDVVHADWQGRLLDGLAGQGFEMLCKQHPEGLLRGEPLKLSAHAKYVGGRFHDCIDQADAFVFDYPATTALWEAVCTRKPVLFVDLGLADWNPTVWAKFAQRCAVVTAQFDERNRPVVDFEAAAEALRAAPMDDAFATEYLTGQAR